MNKKQIKALEALAENIEYMEVGPNYARFRINLNDKKKKYEISP